MKKVTEYSSIWQQEVDVINGVYNRSVTGSNRSVTSSTSCAEYQRSHWYARKQHTVSVSHHFSVSIWSGQVYLHWRLPCSVHNKQHCWLISPEINLSRQIFRHFFPTMFQAVSSKVRFQASGSVCCCLKCFLIWAALKRPALKCHVPCVSRKFQA